MLLKWVCFYLNIQWIQRKMSLEEEPVLSAEETAIRALNALHVVAPDEVVTDVKAKVLAAFEEIKTSQK